MNTAALIPMKWAEEKREDDELRCACCDRAIKGAPQYVEVINGGDDVAAPGLGPDPDDPGYMGAFPVGPTCARKHFKGFTFHA